MMGLNWSASFLAGELDLKESGAELHAVKNGSAPPEKFLYTEFGADRIITDEMVLREYLLIKKIMEDNRFFSVQEDEDMSLMINITAIAFPITTSILQVASGEIHYALRTNNPVTFGELDQLLSDMGVLAWAEPSPSKSVSHAVQEAMVVKKKVHDLFHRLEAA